MGIQKLQELQTPKYTWVENQYGGKTLKKAAAIRDVDDLLLDEQLGEEESVFITPAKNPEDEIEYD